MEKREILSHTEFFFRQINFLVISLVKPLFSRNFCVKSVRESLQFPHTQRYGTQCGKTKNLVSPKNISSNQLFSNFFSKNATFTKFLPKMCETKSQQFPHCTVREFSLTQFRQKFRESNVCIY